MPITQTHEMHTRRFGRNLGVALCLVAFAAIVFGLTIAKIREGASMEAFDHQPRVSVTPSSRSNRAALTQNQKVVTRLIGVSSSWARWPGRRCRSTTGSAG
jgi:hypothetical protein